MDRSVILIFRFFSFLKTAGDPKHTCLFANDYQYQCMHATSMPVACRKSQITFSKSQSAPNHRSGILSSVIQADKVNHDQRHHWGFGRRSARNITSAAGKHCSLTPGATMSE
jgi:hypothetical protein